MKMKIPFLFTGVAAFTFFLTACDKNETVSAATESSSEDITVAASATGGTTDSVTFDHQCGLGGARDTIAVSGLPAAVTDYLSANYEGYTFHKAFVETDSSGTVENYIVVIYYNEEPVGLKFSAAGEFEGMLRQRRKGHRR